MKCLLVSHNAGGAALLAAWAAHQADRHFECLLSGPAVGIFCQRLASAHLIAVDAVVLAHYDCVITSTSAAETAWETVWIVKARAQSIKTISLLDHWTNYISRFQLQNRLQFPDEIWVSDDYAQALALQCRQEQPLYPPVVKIPNYYLADQAEFIQSNHAPACNVECILFVSEPSFNPFYTAVEALSGFLNYLLVSIQTPKIIRLRVHRRENSADYAAVCAQFTGRLNLEFSSNSRLEDDLCWATWVVGCQTMAMVVAMAAGLKVNSCLPACVATSALPHREIERLFPTEVAV
jgi:hypothetical protein